MIAYRAMPAQISTTITLPDQPLPRLCRPPAIFGRRRLLKSGKPYNGVKLRKLLPQCFLLCQGIVGAHFLEELDHDWQLIGVVTLNPQSPTHRGSIGSLEAAAR